MNSTGGLGTMPGPSPSPCTNTSQKPQSTFITFSQPQVRTDRTRENRSTKYRARKEKHRMGNTERDNKSTKWEAGSWEPPNQALDAQHFPKH